MKKIVAIVGSLRKDSYNKHLANLIKERYKDQLDTEIADIHHLPFYNQDEELDPTETVKNFKKQVADSDGVIIITPEYNWSVPGVLKNALDWLSRVDKVLTDKPILTAGASARVLPPGGNEVLVNFASQKVDESGRLIDEPTLDFLDGVIEKFAKWIG